MTTKSYYYLTAGFILLTFTGCISLEQTTLPANQQKVYQMAGYDLTAPDNPEWRFVGMNKDLEQISFIHADNYSRLFFWVTPLLKHYSDEEKIKRTVEYFQNKVLKEFKLSPDINLNEQSIKKSDARIAGIPLSLLEINYTIKNENFRVKFYYVFKNADELMFNFAIWMSLKEFKDPDWEKNLLSQFEDMLKGMTFKNPRKEEVIKLRANYALSDFNESIDKRYLADEFKDLTEKYTIAKKEILSWIQLKGDTAPAYNLLGELTLFNQKFEKFGTGFDKEKAVYYFRKSLELRNYYKEPFLNLSRLSKATNEIDRAVKYYETVIQISPNDENVYYELGKIYEEKGDLAKAKEYYTKAIRHWGSGFATLNELKIKLKQWEGK